MKSLMRVLTLGLTLLTVASCSDVAFQSKKPKKPPTPNCQGANCPVGNYAWYEGGFGACSKPCGGGTATQTVECRKVSDNSVVPDSFCSGAKPASTKSCNIQACTNTYTWNIGAYGSCSVTCGGGTKVRTVYCQDQNGTTVADNLCSQPKPATSESCNNTDACPVYSYSWYVTQGTCSKQCGGGTATDTVVCKRNDGSIVNDSYCAAVVKPPTTRTCNTDACPETYTYTWDPQPWGACSKDCGDGLQTRSLACKRTSSSGMIDYVSDTYCPAATKPPTQQACKIKDCPGAGRKVTQVTTVPPAQNLLDVILIIDDSGSMKEDQTKLAQRMSGLLADLDALNIDYQVCLTTTDISYYKGAPIKWKGIEQYVMKKNSPNKNSVFLQTIDALGAEWSSDEQGIKAMWMMINDFKGVGCLRDNSTLTTILVSDENERSVGGNQSWSNVQYKPLTAENYPDTLIAKVKSAFYPTKPFIWNSIIVKPGDTACEAAQDAQTSPSFFGTLYAELSTKTNGHIGSICDGDYSNNLKLIKNKVVGSMPGLTMECTPIDTPVVTFDRPVTTSVSVVGNQLKFTPALPEGVVVTAKYTCPN